MQTAHALGQPDRDRPHLHRIGEGLYFLEASTVSFAPLRGITREQFLSAEFSRSHPHRNMIETLRQIVAASKREWERLAKEGHHFNRETLEQHLDRFTRPSARVVVLCAKSLPSSSMMHTQSTVVGYYRWMTNLDDVVDKHLLPMTYLKETFWDSGRYPEGVFDRADRAIVTDLGRKLAPRGEALDKIMEEYERSRNGRPCITRIIVEPERLAFSWSSNAFQMRGFAATGQYLHVEDELLNGEKVELKYEWFVYPPHTDAGFRTMESFTRKFDGLKRAERGRIGHAAAHFSPSGGSIAVVGPGVAADAAMLARLFPANRVYAVGEEAVPNDIANLRAVPSSGVPSGIQGIFAADLPDLAALGPVIERLAPDGTVVLSGTGASAVTAQRFGLRMLYLRADHGRTVLAAEKIAPGAACYMSAADPEPRHGRGVSTRPHLSVEVYRHSRTNERLEMIRRGDPGTITVDALPHSILDGTVIVYLKCTSTRPVVLEHRGMRDVGAVTSGYVGEQLSKVVMLPPYGMEHPRDFLDRAVDEILVERGALPPSVGGPIRTCMYYPSPGGVNESVSGYLAQVEAGGEMTRPAPYLLATGAGIRPVELERAISECTMGCLQSGREERLLYQLLLQRRLPLGPWLGDEIRLTEHDIDLPTRTFAELSKDRDPAMFHRVDEVPRFFVVHERSFREHDSRGRVLAQRNLSYGSLHPDAPYGDDTIVIAPVIKTTQGVFIGLERRELPSVQDSSFSPTHYCVPAFRIRKELTSWEQGLEFAFSSLRYNHRVAPTRYEVLGAEWFPSLGILPERAFLVLAEIAPSTARSSNLSWTPLDEFVMSYEAMRDGHSMTAGFRTAHALGILRDPRRSFS